MTAEAIQSVCRKLSFLSLAGTGIMIPFMPDRVPMHYDTAGNIDRWGSRYENLIFPMIIIAMSLFWTLLISHYERKALKAMDQKERDVARANGKLLGIVGLCMSVMFTIELQKQNQ